jgi:hypothetical protein
LPHSFQSLAMTYGVIAAFLSVARNDIWRNCRIPFSRLQ